MRYKQKSLVGSSGKTCCPWSFFFLPPPPWNKDVMAGAPAVILDHNTKDQNMLRMAEQEERQTRRSPEAALAALAHPPLGFSTAKGNQLLIYISFCS